MKRKHEWSEKYYQTDLKFGLAFLLCLLFVLLVTGCDCREDEGTRNDYKAVICK